MDGKRPATSQDANPAVKPKKQRKAITVGVKLDVISRFEKGENIAEICRAHQLKESTVRTIRNNAQKINESTNSGTAVSADKTSYARSSLMEKMESMLSTWIEDQNKRNLPVSMFLTQAKALSIYEDLAKGVDKVKVFNASSGWFANFKKRYSVHIKMSGDAAAPAEIRAADNFMVVLEATIKKGGYSSKQIFNLDETTLFWKRMPSRTYIAQEEVWSQGFKASKDRFSLLLGGNAEGDCKLTPVVVYHSANPRALKGYVKNLLPVHFYANSKGVVSGSLFCDYIVSKFQDELRQYCTKEKLDYKILLLVDSAPGHPPSIQDLSDNVKVIFLPPNTSLMQPMDQGVIATFKACYLRKTFEALATATEDNKMTVRDFWNGFTIRDSIVLVAEAWKAVTRLCMNGVWKNLCPYFVKDFNEFNVDEDLFKIQEAIVELAKKVGFAEVDLYDVVQLLNTVNEELTTEEIYQLWKEHQEEERTAEVEVVRSLTSKRLAKALRLVKDGLTILGDDPDTPRGSRVTKAVLEEMHCYSKILKEKIASQKTLLSFFKGKESVDSLDSKTPTKKAKKGAKCAKAAPAVSVPDVSLSQ